jgi:hypothetical protein
MFIKNGKAKHKQLFVTCKKSGASIARRRRTLPREGRSCRAPVRTCHAHKVLLARATPGQRPHLRPRPRLRPHLTASTLTSASAPAPESASTPTPAPAPAFASAPVSAPAPAPTFAPAPVSAPAPAPRSAGVALRSLRAATLTADRAFSPYPVRRIPLRSRSVCSQLHGTTDLMKLLLARSSWLRSPLWHSRRRAPMMPCPPFPAGTSSFSNPPRCRWTPKSCACCPSRDYEFTNQATTAVRWSTPCSAPFRLSPADRPR